MSSPDRSRSSFFQRSLRFWSTHLLLLQIALFGLVWVLYGSLELRGHGSDYLARAADIRLERDPARFNTAPGIENVLVPAAAAAIAKIWTTLGFEFTDAAFVLLTIAPYPIFIYGVTLLVRGRTRSGVLAGATAIALYTSGMIPYMASWGGYLDGMSYLLMLPVLLWPESLAVYTAAFVLQCLNHYLGAVSLVMLAFVWHTAQAAERPDGTQYWLRTFVPRAAVSALLLAGFVWFWAAQYPDASRARATIAAEKWSDPAALVTEVIGPFPWTLLSTLKLTIVPVMALMIAPLPRRPLRALALAVPFIAAAALTLVFVDVTRVATMVTLPALLVTVLAAGRYAPPGPPAARRSLRRLIVATALLNLLLPNYYVNNGELQVPPSRTIRGAIEWLVPAGP
jgi:hypothetical protein